MNESGIEPLEYKVLILPDEIEESNDLIRRAKAAGIELIQDTKDREQMKQTTGILVDFGCCCFDARTDGEWLRKPNRGDRVYFSKYAGDVIPGKDGKDYRLCLDKDIAAIIR